jgi:hypothetical protein
MDTLAFFFNKLINTTILSTTTRIKVLNSFLYSEVVNYIHSLSEKFCIRGPCGRGFDALVNLIHDDCVHFSVETESTSLTYFKCSSR